MIKKDWLIWSLVFLVFATSVFAIYLRPDGKLKVHFFDVGQGDAMLLEVLKGQQILVDGGPDNTVIEKIAGVLPFYDKTIELVVLTHPHKDHLSGLIEVLKRYRVKAILETGIKCDTPECLTWEKSKEKEKAEVISAKLGQVIKFDGGAKIYILHPFEDLRDKKVENFNNASVLMRLVFKDSSVILTGDAEYLVEEKLLSQNIFLDSDILKVGHQGSATSSRQEFLEKISPQIALISVGKNSYGHPHKEVLERLEKLNIKYYRTDINGDIKLVSRGKSWQIQEKRKLSY